MELERSCSLESLVICHLSLVICYWYGRALSRLSAERTNDPMTNDSIPFQHSQVMPLFRYETRESGSAAAGVFQAASLTAAVEQLHARGAVILDLCTGGSLSQTRARNFSFT